MRPSILYPLFAPIEVLKGIGNKYAKLVKIFAEKKLLTFCFICRFQWLTGHGCRRSFRHKMAEYGPEL